MIGYAFRGSGACNDKGKTRPRYWIGRADYQ
jgi:hypothetical protein